MDPTPPQGDTMEDKLALLEKRIDTLETRLKGTERLVNWLDEQRYDEQRWRGLNVFPSPLVSFPNNEFRATLYEIIKTYPNIPIYQLVKEAQDVWGFCSELNWETWMKKYNISSIPMVR